VDERTERSPPNSSPPSPPSRHTSPVSIPSSGSARGPNSPTPSARTLIFSDEFNGTAIDPAWLPFNGSGHAGYGLRRPSAAAVDGKGSLVLTGRTENGKTVAGGLAAIRANFTYGRVEFRVKTETDPTGNVAGVVLTWPQQQWAPEFTENDMYETGPIPNNNYRFDSFIHFGVNNWQKWKTHDVDPTQWHTIAMEWYPDMLEIYVDNELAFRIDDPAVIPDVLHHVCIQLDATAVRTIPYPVRMTVDYIRVYE